jgi:hypothetical protein
MKKKLSCAAVTVTIAAPALTACSSPTGADT